MMSRFRDIYTERAGEKFLGKDALISSLITFPLAMPIVRAMQKGKLRVHPNVITLASLAPVLLAAYFFAKGLLTIGAVLYYGYYLMDTVDGKWARLTGQTSKLGERLDYFVGAFGNLALYFGLWYSQYYLAGDWLTGGAIILAHYWIMVVMGVFLKSPYYKTIFPRVGSYYSDQEEGVGTFFFAPLFNIVRVLFPILVAAQLVSVLILFLRQGEKPADIRAKAKKVLLKL
jgi:phosphatidylglycerophosphate synthase